MKQIILLGTCHIATHHYDDNDLFCIIEALKPSVIFEEFDCNYKKNEHSELKKLEYIEGRVLKDYAKKYSNCLIVPYDIENRGKTYKDNNYFDNENRFYAALEGIYKGNMLLAEDKTVYEKLGIIFELRDSSLIDEYPRVINSTFTDKLLEKKEELLYPLIKKVVKEYEELRQYKEFVEFEESYWIKRNSAMVKNIIKEMKKVKENDRAIVLCGFEHRYIMKKLFIEESKNIEVKEYWEV